MAIPIQGLVTRRSRRFAQHLHNASGRDRVVAYWKNGRGLGRAFGPMSTEESRAVSRLFSLVDRLTGVRFVAVSRRATADIQVHRASALPDDLLGYAQPMAYGARIVWRDLGGPAMRSLEKHIVAHEILHTLGLDHPFGNGFNRRYDTRDTVMSYHYRGWRGLTSSDVRALRSLWGA
ncbi:hypothetical protein [Cyanobium sp. NIES-981]|uniref:hypothetical protein n=1 Tax=Cyanobium sp. NIES-981 TaxID=1851505 RepID=UPI0007DCF4CB|nr:hypothetical protein [Cyanobium sp. NIES-981]SBO43206.1 conserved protein of unknown function [Cyanobium sp. NIES-981]